MFAQTFLECSMNVTVPTGRGECLTQTPGGGGGGGGGVVFDAFLSTLENV